MKFKIGLQLYSVNMNMADDFEGTLQAVKDMGYDCVEFAGYFGKSAKEVKEILDRLGLEAISAHHGLNEFEQQGRELTDYLKEIGVKYCAVPWFDKSKLKGSDEWEQTKKGFIEYSNALKKADIKLLYHNHAFEFEKYDGEYLMDWIFDELSENIIAPEIDTCWVHYAGENPCEYIKKYSGKIDLVHLKDFSCSKLGKGPVYDIIRENNYDSEAKDELTGFELQPVGYGNEDFKSVAEACDKAGASYLIVEVEQNNWNKAFELEGAEKSIKYLRESGL